MTNTERILNFLVKHGDRSYCDDCLSQKVGIFPRQQINSICRSLFSAGKIRREIGTCCICSRQKCVNQIGETALEGTEKQNNLSKRSRIEGANQPWYWEGKVQARLISWLQDNGYIIIGTADTKSRSKGVDIKAKDSQGRTLWISVKGYPETNKPHTPARHYFASAVFDMIMYWSESNSVNLAIGLPAGFATYENLVKKVARFRKEIFPFDIYWVSEDGSVRKE